MENNTNEDTGKEMVLYQIDNQQHLEVHVAESTIWLTQKQMAELYGTEVPAISKHIKNIFNTGDLNENRTVSKMEIVQSEGKRNVNSCVKMYNLGMIIAVGYRINIKQLVLEFGHLE